MKPGALAPLLAILGLGLVLVRTADASGERVRGCMPPSQAREVLIQQRLVAPFRALGEASRGGTGDVVGLQLCRMGDDFVYDVTMLQRDGRVSHALIDARNGAPIAAARTGK